MTCWAAPMKEGLRGGNAVWSLSALCARQHFDRLILFADALGEVWLSDLLALPFDEIYPLRISDDFKPLWALGKIVAYHEMGNRREPFVHIDGDVCLLAALPERLLAAPVIAEMAEQWEPPAWLVSQIAFPKPWLSYLYKCRQRMWNCGIFGGNDVDRIRAWASMALRLAEWNRNNWAEINGGAFSSMLLEQWSLSAEFADNEITTLIPVGGAEPGYVHLKEGKFSPAWRGRVERELIARFPHQAERIGLKQAA